MRRDLVDVYRAFDGKFVGSYQMKLHVCEVVSKLPKKVAVFVCRNCWFMSSMEDAYAFTFTGDDLAKQHLIFISDELLMQDKRQIEYTIAHEIGHVVLKHRNSTLVRQSKEEVRKQESEADEFARKYVV